MLSNPPYQGLRGYEDKYAPLTIIANALRVGDHLLERLHGNVPAEREVLQPVAAPDSQPIALMIADQVTVRLLESSGKPTAPLSMRKVTGLGIARPRRQDHTVSGTA